MKAALIDAMGTDLTVVNAARVSFNKKSDYEATYSDDYESIDYSLPERDQKLIKYLAKHGHWTPFAHPQITLHIKAPIFVRTQCFKHKQGFVENEVSRRYVDDEPTFFMPKEWRGRPTHGAKQGSDGIITELTHPAEGVGSEDLWGDVDNKFHPDLHVSYMYQCVLDNYKWLLDSGVAPEQARMVLPQAMYTEWWWTGSLAAYARFYNQRTDPHAQKEIQELARMVGQEIEPMFPYSWKALTNEE